MDILIAAGARSWEQTAIELIETREDLRLLRRCVDTVDLVAAAPDARYAVALVDPDLAGLDADTIWQLTAGGARVFLVSAQSETHRTAELAENLGASGSVDSADLASFLATITTAPQASSDPRLTREPSDEFSNGRILAVWGPAGAPGRTTLAVGLADQFAAAAHERVALMDADPYGGAVAGVLGVMDEVSGLLAAIRAANNGHHGAAGQSMYRVGNMDVLTGLPHAHMWVHARAAGFSKVLREARQGWSTTVIDTGFAIEDDTGPEALAPKRNQLTLMALEAADQIIVCGSGDPVGLSRLVRGLHELHDLVPACEPLVVVNRFRGSLGWPRREIADTVQRLTGRRPDVFVPYDVDTLDRAVIEGRTVREVDPGCEVAAAYAAAAGLCGRGAAVASEIGASEIGAG